MRILILCTGNSCRSQMAHGFLQSFDRHIEVYSAGTSPAKHVHPIAISVMSEVGALGCIRNEILHKGSFVDNKLVIVKENTNRLRVDYMFDFRGYSQYDDALKGFSFREVHILGKKYDDAIIIDNKNSVLNVKGDIACEYFIWSKSKGLLQYKYLNGDVYTFYKKLPYKRKD